MNNASMLRRAASAESFDDSVFEQAHLSPGRVIAQPRPFLRWLVDQAGWVTYQTVVLLTFFFSLRFVRTLWMALRTVIFGMLIFKAVMSVWALSFSGQYVLRNVRYSDRRVRRRQIRYADAKAAARAAAIGTASP